MSESSMGERVRGHLRRAIFGLCAIGLVFACLCQACDLNRSGSGRRTTNVEGYPEQLARRLERHAAILDRVGVNKLIHQQSTLWKAGETLTVAFRGGDSDRIQQIADVAREWSAHANIHFDFGSPPAWRSWSSRDTTYRSTIRVSFARSNGLWSLTGTEALNPELAGPGEPSMCLGGFDDVRPDHWEAIVRHEFGHAIGLLHEHQSPANPCTDQLRWEDDDSGAGLFTVFGASPFHWPRERVLKNFDRLPDSDAYVHTEYDPASIMHYAFEAWMFKAGESSPCYTRSRTREELSNIDITSVAGVYPRDPERAAVSNGLRKKALNEVATVLAAGRAEAPEADRALEHVRSLIGE